MTLKIAGEELTAAPAKPTGRNRTRKTDIATTVIVLFSMHYDPVVLREFPFMNRAAERGFSQVAALRDERTRLVIIIPEPINEHIVDYYLRDVAGFSHDELPDVLSRLELLRPRQDESAALDTLTLRDESLREHLRDLVQRSANTRLVNFTASIESDVLSADLAVAAEQQSHRLVEHWGSKSGGKHILRLAGVPMPAGPIEKIYDLDGVVAACRELGAAADPPTLVVLKLDDPKWSAAVGNVILDRAVVAASADVRSGVVTCAQPWPTFVRNLAEEGAVLETYFEDVVAAPSGQGFIDLAGQLHLTSTHDQLLNGDRYAGVISPASPEFVDRIYGHVAATGEVLSRYGVRGVFGVDFIARPDGSLLSTEINLRKVGPSHVSAHLRDIASLADVHYIHRRVLEPDRIGTMTAREVIETLRAHGLLFDHSTSTGVLLHMLSAVARYGYLETTTVESTRARAFALEGRVRRALGLEPIDDPALAVTM